MKMTFHEKVNKLTRPIPPARVKITRNLSLAYTYGGSECKEHTKHFPFPPHSPVRMSEGPHRYGRDNILIISR